MAWPRDQKLMTLHEKVLLRKIKEAVGSQHQQFWGQQGKGKMPKGVSQMIAIYSAKVAPIETLDGILVVARQQLLEAEQKDAAYKNSLEHRFYEAIVQAATPIPHRNPKNDIGPRVDTSSPKGSYIALLQEFQDPKNQVLAVLSQALDTLNEIIQSAERSSSEVKVEKKLVEAPILKEKKISRSCCFGIC